MVHVMSKWSIPGHLVFACINNNVPFVEVFITLMQQNDDSQLFHPQLINIAGGVQWHHSIDVALTPGWMWVVCVISGGSVLL